MRILDDCLSQTMEGNLDKKNRSIHITDTIYINVNFLDNRSSYFYCL